MCSCASHVPHRWHCCDHLRRVHVLALTDKMYERVLNEVLKSSFVFFDCCLPRAERKNKSLKSMFRRTTNRRWAVCAVLLSRTGSVVAWLPNKGFAFHDPQGPSAVALPSSDWEGQWVPVGGGTGGSTHHAVWTHPYAPLPQAARPGHPMGFPLGTRRGANGRGLPAP